MAPKKEPESAQKPPHKEEIVHFRPTAPGQKPVRMGKRETKSGGKER